MSTRSKKRLSFERSDLHGIPLREVIAVHKRFRSPKALAGNLGDAFLYAQNPVFRNLRDEFLARGFSFTLEDFCNYFAFPLMSLDHVIAAGKIPYRANFPWLEIIERNAPGTFTLTELKRSELQFNYLFHESAHFIAHDVFFGRKLWKRLPKNSDTLLRILIGEAFANTAECVSAAFPEGEIGAYFLDANCHFRANAREVRTIRSFARRFGFEPVTRILLAAFLYSNFLHEKLGKKERALIFSFSEIKKSTSIAPLVEIGLQLSEQFRTTTTHFHLMKTGFPPTLARRMRFDPLARLLKKQHSPLREEVAKLTAVICRGLGREPRSLP